MGEIKQGRFRKFEILDEREHVDTDPLVFPWQEDTNGYFLIKLEEGKIKCGFLADNKMIMEFEGTDPHKMAKEIAKRKIITMDHMVYISQELMIAADCLKNKKEYVQR